VPGCGSGYEVAALAAAGFEVTAFDYASAAIGRARERLDHAGLDAIYEQTCLCALYPDQWRDYADQLHRWLAPATRAGLPSLRSFLDIAAEAAAG
jgi:hypothetical protein